MIFCIFFFVLLIACPAVANWKPGGYDCVDTCINGNKVYRYFAQAWAECGRISQCAKIMKYSNFQFFLRKADDRYVSSSTVEYVDYSCGGKKTKNLTKSFVLSHISKIFLSIINYFCISFQ